MYLYISTTRPVCNDKFIILCERHLFTCMSFTMNSHQIFMKLLGIFVILECVLVQIASGSSNFVEPPGNYGTLAGYSCGRTKQLPDNIIWNIGNDDKAHSLYYLNATADELRNKGFEVTVTEMGDAPITDQIKAMTYTNGKESGSYYIKDYAGRRRLVVGGERADRVRAESMAIIGDKRRGKIAWFCNGVLINNFWVLSAAHCLLDSNVQANIIRLGEYDRSTDFDFGETQIPYYSSTLDSEIEKIVPHTDFVLTERYHDIVLFKLKRPAPLWSLRILPICLPWGDYKVKEDLVGKDVTLTGWGATSFGRQNDVTQVLQQVKVTVFETNKCEKSYSLLKSFQTNYPKGMSDEHIICAGSYKGGKDTCKGDSGGPMVYDNNHFYRFTVIGIVSGGHGCGDKDFPGLYIPIYKPKYLQWIKDVAFSNLPVSKKIKKITPSSMKKKVRIPSPFKNELKPKSGSVGDHGFPILSVLLLFLTILTR